MTSMSKGLRAIASILSAGSMLAMPVQAQSCNDYSAEGAGVSREVAVRQAYIALLNAAGVNGQVWASQNMRIGEAPGAIVQKLGTRCQAGGPGQICRLDATICRN